MGRAKARSWSILWSVIAISGRGGRGGSGTSDAGSPVSSPPSSDAPTRVTAGTTKPMWFPPTTYEYGSPFINLGGFRVYLGTSHLNLPRTSIDVANPSAITRTVGGLRGATDA